MSRFAFAGLRGRIRTVPRWPLSVPARASADVDVVVFGENSLDFVGVGPIGTTLAPKTTLGGFAMHAGGQSATAAVALARQGHRVRYLGSFGDDEASRTVEAALARERVQVAPIRRPGARGRVAILLVDEATGERSVFEYQDPASRLGAEDVPEAVVCSGRVLMLDATHPAAARQAAALARAAGIPVVVDIDRPAPDTGDLLALIDVIVVPELFLRTWTGCVSPEAGLAELAARYPAPVVIVTLGAGGSLARVLGEEIRTPGFPVEVVDSTGAGDAFRGGLVSAWLAMGQDAEAILARANATAALNCRAAGAQAGLPASAEVEARVTGGPHGRSN
jgi:sugar/nucleoside kinase (ribokinase family)